MGELVSQAEFARRVNVSRQRIGRLVKSGRLRLRRKKLDYEEAVAEFEATRDISQPSKINGASEDAPAASSADVADDGGWSYSKARRERERAAANMAKLRFDEARGVLVEKSTVEAEAFALARIVRDALLAVPSRLRDTLTGIDDPKRVHSILLAEMTAIVGELECDGGGS